MGLVFFCTWIIGGLGGWGCKITWNVFQISSTLLTPFTTLYVRNLYLTPPPPLPSPLSGKEQTRSFCDNQYSLASYFHYFKKMFATIIFGHGS